ncbi:MAG: hypothetical protein QOC77_3739 [Thermoleophilaceae bacterium]|nr:hypothetical protein [Thermoleophilaceae bacterium]
MPDFLVNRGELSETRLAESDPPELESGQALLRVHAFGLTANNVTYAVFGDAMSYWNFFPASDPGWGRVPMWGFAEVERSEAEGLEPSTRVYGYLPPSSHFVVTPTGTGPRGFVDGSAHRAALPSAYNQYNATATDPFYTADTEELHMLLRPLFYTSFLIDDMLADEELATRGPVVISSASSKTAIGTAFLLARRDGVELIGLTSERSAAFVDGLGIYGRTVTYDEIGSLGGGLATFVDIAGDGGVRRAVHSAYGEDLLASIAVGATHWGAMGTGGGGDLPGPVPALFFAPDRVAKRSADWGAAGLTERAASAWHPFCSWAGEWLEVEAGEGFEAVERAWVEVLEGRVAPERAHVLSLSGIGSGQNSAKLASPATWSDPGAGEQLWFLGTLATIKLPGEASGGRFALIEFLFPHNASPPLHTHPQDESYVVLDGRLTIRAGDERFELEAGGAAVVPMGVPHTFRVDSETARVLVLSTPAGLERMVRDASVPATAPTLPPADAPRPSGNELERIFAAHGQVNNGPPLGPGD